MLVTTKCVQTMTQEYRAVRDVLCVVNTHVYLQLLEKLLQSIVPSTRVGKAHKKACKSDLLRRVIPRPEFNDKITTKYAEESYKLFGQDRKPGNTLKSSSYRQKSFLICFQSFLEL